MVVQLLADHCGYEPDEIHEALKGRFLRDRKNEVSGIPKIRSSAGLTTVEFMNYIEDCRRLGAELGVVIPDPDPTWRLNAIDVEPVADEPRAIGAGTLSED